jgi:hypothetical protein
MHRIFGLMALAAAAYGVWVLFSAPEADTLARAASEGSGAYRTWAFGLVTGLFLAALWMIDWRDLPARMSTWLAVQRRRLGLILIGGLCAGVLLLF